MEPSEETFEALPAKRVLEMIFQTLDSYFPSSLRARFEKVAAAFEKKDQLHWIETVGAKKRARYLHESYPLLRILRPDAW